MFAIVQELGCYLRFVANKNHKLKIFVRIICDGLYSNLVPGHDMTMLYGRLLIRRA